MPDTTSYTPGGAPQSNTGGTAKTPTADTLKTDASTLLDKAKGEFGSVASEAKEQVAGLADQAKAQVAETTEKLKGLAGEQKDALVNQVTGVSDAIEKVATELEQSNSSGAQYVRMVADSAAKLTETVENKNVDELLGMAQDFGRKQPAAFIGAAALLGFAASRFLLASAKRQETAAPVEPMSTGYEQQSDTEINGTSQTSQTNGSTGGYTPSNFGAGRI